MNNSTQEKKPSFYSDANGVLLKMNPKVRYQLLGEVASLLMCSDLHRRYLINDLGAVFLPPLHLNQFRIYKRGDRPVAFITWARLTEEVEKKYMAGTYNLKPEDWNAGDRGWVIDFVCPFGDMKEITEDLRRNIFPDEVGKAIRIDADGNVKGLVKLHGINRAGDMKDIEVDMKIGRGNEPESGDENTPASQ